MFLLALGSTCWPLPTCPEIVIVYGLDSVALPSCPNFLDLSV